MVGHGAEPLINTYCPVLEGEGGSAGITPEHIHLLVNDRICTWALPQKVVSENDTVQYGNNPSHDLMLGVKLDACRWH